MTCANIINRLTELPHHMEKRKFKESQKSSFIRLLIVWKQFWKTCIAFAEFLCDLLHYNTSMKVSIAYYLLLELLEKNEAKVERPKSSLTTKQSWYMHSFTLCPILVWNQNHTSWCFKKESSLNLNNFHIKHPNVMDDTTTIRTFLVHKFMKMQWPL